MISGISFWYESGIVRRPADREQWFERAQSRRDAGTAYA